MRMDSGGRRVFCVSSPPVRRVSPCTSTALVFSLSLVPWSCRDERTFTSSYKNSQKTTSVTPNSFSSCLVRAQSRPQSWISNVLCSSVEKGFVGEGDVRWRDRLSSAAH